MELAQEFDKLIHDKYSDKIPPHRIIFDYFIKFINNKNINYVIIRGFQKLPLLPDTDLDIMVEKKNFQKLCSLLKCSKYFSDRAPGHMLIDNMKCIYHPFFTVGQKDNSIPNGCFRLDIHNAFCFFYKNKVVLPQQIENIIYDTKIMYKQLYYIPNNQWEFILLLYRIVFDLGGRIRDKHINRLKYLQKQLIFNYGAIKYCLNMIKKHNTNIFNLLSKFIDTNLPPIDNTEYHAFIFWTDKAVNMFKDEIKKTHMTIIDNTNIDIKDKNERHNKVNQIYEIEFSKDNIRVTSNEPIRLYIIRDTKPIYDTRVTAGLKITKIVNKNVFNLKRILREKYFPTDVHSSDEVNEANKIFMAFNQLNYLNKSVYVPLKYTRGVVWKTPQPNRSYELRNITDTPHYKYITDNKKEYIEYVNNIDKVHSNLDNFKELIVNFDPIRCFSKDDIPTAAILDNGIYLIYDGLHRISLLEYFGYTVAKFNIINPIQRDNSVYGKLQPISIAQI